MKEINSGLDKETQNSIIGMLKDIENIQSFIMQEIINSVKANNGKIFSVDDARLKAQTNSLLNANPLDESNKGKPVISFKATEIGIQEKLKSLEEKGVPIEELNKVRSVAEAARQNFTEKLGSQEGLHDLISTRVASQFIMESANFAIKDKETERFLTREEKINIVKTFEKQVIIPPKLLEILLDPTKAVEVAIIKKSFRSRLEEALSGPEKSQSNLALLDMNKLNDATTVQKFSESVNFSFNSAAFLTNYPELSKTLITNVRAIYSNGSTRELQNAFKENGSLHAVINMLAEKEKNAGNVLRNLNEMPFTKENKTIKQEIINNATKELEEIHAIQSQLSALSSTVGGARSNLDARKAINNFSYGLEQHKEVKQGFVGTLASVIYNAFVRRDPEQLAASTDALKAIGDKFNTEINNINSTLNLVKTPGIEKTIDSEQKALSPDIPPPPPPPMEPEKKKPSHVSKLGEKQEKKKVGGSDMLKDIKEAKLKSNNKAVDMNIDGFTYIPEIGLEKKSDHALNSVLMKRRASLDPEEQVKDLMKGKGEQAKLNTLYSAVINGNTKLVDNIIEHGSAKVFTKENCQKIYNAVKEIIKSITPIKKIIIEKGMETLAQEAKLGIQKTVLSQNFHIRRK